MTGRDIIKFIVANNLLDKQCVSDNFLVKFVDNMQDDEEIGYVLLDSGRERVYVRDSSDTYVLRQRYISDVTMSGIKQVDTCIPEDDILSPYNTYSETFRSWLSNSESSGPVISIIKDYADSDSNFSRNCGTYNKMISYLEGKEVSKEVIESADVAWLQYMRECREV